MSLFDTFDPHSEELIKVNQQRSFQEAEDFPELVIGAFKETFRLLEKRYQAEQVRWRLGLGCSLLRENDLI